MSNARIAAIDEGTTYQRLIFWKYAFNLLLPDSDIALVKYEESELTPCDDVVVCYKHNLYEDEISCPYNADYIQCKFKVGNENKIKFTDLIDPNYYGNKESFLFRAHKLYSSLDDKNVRLILYSTVFVDSDDEIFKEISNVNHALRIENLFKSKKRAIKCTLEKAKKHIGVSEDEFKDFLSRIRFKFGKSIEDEREQIKNICGLANIKYDRSQTGDKLSEILRRMNLSRKTNFDCKTVSEICIENNLYIKKENYIGVISNSWGDDKAKQSQSYGDNVLDLTKYFDGKTLKYEFSWSDVIKEIKGFCNSRIKFGEKYVFNLSSIYSVCFAVGKQIGYKIAQISFINRAGCFEKELFERCAIAEEKEEICDDTSNNENAILAFSFNGSIIDDVRDYVVENIPNSRILSEVINAPMQNITNNLFWMAMESFCEEARSWLKSVKPEHIHIFYRGPAEGAFVIGQYAKEWGECTVYEFAFGAKPKEQKYYKGITF